MIVVIDELARIRADEVNTIVALRAFPASTEELLRSGRGNYLNIFVGRDSLRSLNGSVEDGIARRGYQPKVGYRFWLRRDNEQCPVHHIHIVDNIPS